MQQANRVQLTAVDYGLVFMLLLGIYLEVAIYLSPTVPIPSVIAGAAGAALIWRRRDDFTARQLAAFMTVVLVLVLSCLAAPDWSYLPKRMTGLIQMTYSLVIAFALFLTLIRAERTRVSRILLWMCVVILIGAQLEAIPAIRDISDGARQLLYRSGIYESDLRDILFYGKVRPKFFTSEPSAVTFAFSLFSLAWFLASDHRHRLLIFCLMMGASQLIIPGPTTLIAILAAGVSYVMLPPRTAGQSTRRVMLVMTSMVVAGALVAAAAFFYGERIDTIMHGRDPSFFYRVIGPTLVGLEVLIKHPLTGIGLTAEQFAADLAMNVFVQSPNFSSAWRFDKFSDVLTNYFWLHWIYLGIAFGSAVLVAISLWLYSLGIARIAYCWMIWALFGQSSGAYVGPKTWVVLMLIAGVIYSIQRRPAVAARQAMASRPVMTTSGLVQLPYYRKGRMA